MRAGVADKVATELDRPVLSQAERQIAEDIIRAMAHDAAVRVRKAVAESLKHSPNLPRDVALSLARDVEEVALPVLSASSVLNDEDLIAFARDSDAAKQAAIAHRPVVSARVAATLVEVGDEATVAALVANEGYAAAEPRLYLDSGRNTVDWKHGGSTWGSTGRCYLLPSAVSGNSPKRSTY